MLKKRLQTGEALNLINRLRASCIITGVMRMSKDKKAMTKDRLIGMQVYDSEGNAAGTVQDIAFTVGKMGMTLIIEI